MRRRFWSMEMPSAQPPIGSVASARPVVLSRTMSDPCISESRDGGGQGYGVRGMWDGPLVSGKLGITVNAFDRRDPGYIDDPNGNHKNVNSLHVAGGRLAALWQPVERFSAEFSALVQNSSADATSDVDVNSNLTPIYGNYQQLRYATQNWDFDSALYS